jgi:hypothetical protein
MPDYLPDTDPGDEQTTRQGEATLANLPRSNVLRAFYDVQDETGGDPMRFPPSMTDLSGCARCGESHPGIAVYPLTRPMVDDGEKMWTHFATCPTTHEPILFAFYVQTTEAP